MIPTQDDGAMITYFWNDLRVIWSACNNIMIYFASRVHLKEKDKQMRYNNAIFK